VGSVVAVVAIALGGSGEAAGGATGAAQAARQLLWAVTAPDVHGAAAAVAVHREAHGPSVVYFLWWMARIDGGVE
jgi:hypothetical protein